MFGATHGDVGITGRREAGEAATLEGPVSRSRLFAWGLAEAYGPIWGIDRVTCS